MARPVRPVSESYKSVCCSVSQSLSSETAIMGQGEDDDAHSPIFSISKSSMDVVMATGPPHERDPAWTRLKVRRSSSTNTHCEQDAMILERLQSQMWQQVRSDTTNTTSTTSSSSSSSSSSGSSSSSHHLTFINQDMEEPITRGLHKHRWSEYTPATVVWTGGPTRPTSLTQEPCYPLAPDSAKSKLSLPASLTSLVPPPFQRHIVPPVDPSNSNQREDLLVSSPTPSSHRPTSSPNVPLEKPLLPFQLEPSSLSLVEGRVSSDDGCLAKDAAEESQGSADSQAAEITLSTQASPCAAVGQESGERGAPLCYLELPQHQGESSPTQGGGQVPLASSLGDSKLGDCCRYDLNSREDISMASRVKMFREEGTMTSQQVLVDAEVQTISPIGSWWDLQRNISTSNMGSHSILGSPPGSKLNLRISLGSHSNLVSPSSSMFKISSGEDEHGEKPKWEDSSALSHDLLKRRSCLKAREREELGRRSSMKQVQWDEDGLTWEIHGASLDPEELSTAIQKHLELQNSPDPPPKRSSKKKKAPKPPLITSTVKAMAPELNQTTKRNTSPCAVEGKGGEAQEVGKKGGDRTDVRRRMSRAAGGSAKEEEDEVYGEDGHFTLPAHRSDRGRKKSGIRSMGTPSCCGSSKKEHY